MALAIAGITVPVVLAIVGTAWRLAVRLDRIEQALTTPPESVLKLGARVGYVWVLDSAREGHWYPDATPAG